MKIGDAGGLGRGVREDGASFGMFFLVCASVADERPLLNSFQGWSCFCSHFFWSCASWRLRAGLRQMSDLTLTSVLVSDFSVIFQASQACFMRCQSRY